MTAITDGELESPVLDQFPAHEDTADALEDDEAAESEDEGSVVVPSPGTLAAMSGPVPRPSASPFAVFKSAPCTAPTSPSRSPLRREVLGASSPASSPMDASPIRSPTTPKRSPAKHVSRNKENQSPQQHILTVTERLAARSPLLLESILGKRPRNDDAEDLAMLEEKAPKVTRLDASPLARMTANRVQVHAVMHDSSNMQAAEELPCEQAEEEVPKPVHDDCTRPTEEDASPVDSDNESILQATPTPASRKRKGVFMDAVEVPAVETILRARRRLSKSPATEEVHVGTSSAAEQPPLRRTRSATRLLGEQANFHALGTPKRRRLSRADELREEAANLSSPLRSLRDAPLFGSGEYSIASLRSR